MKPKIIAIGGQTASGKSKLAIALAKKFNGEIINTDSRQVYKQLDIGTAKEIFDSQVNDSKAITIQGIPHHLIDIIEPDEDFNLVKFKSLATKIIDDLLSKDLLPILVGGTGLYLDSIIYNYDLAPGSTSKTLRNKLQKLNVQELQKILKQESPDIFLRLNQSDQKNPHRLIRAIEKSRLGIKKKSNEESKYDYLYLAPIVPKDLLEKRIEKRVNSMFKEGLESENQDLRNKGYSTKLRSLKSIGYQEFDKYFQKLQTKEETMDLIKIHTKQYSKRQLTWFKRHKEIIWIKSESQAKAEISKFLGN